MTTSALIRANLSSVRKELSEVFPRISDDMLDWAPAEGMRTIHGQFVEILGTEESIVNALRGLPKKTNAELDGPYWAIKTVDGLIEALAEVRLETLAYMDGLNKAGLTAPATVGEGFSKWLELDPAPVGELLRFIARHESYHSGQLVSYLWARGDNPYKWR